MNTLHSTPTLRIFFLISCVKKMSAEERGSPKKRPRTARIFYTCCQKLIKDVAAVCEEEKSLGCLHLKLQRSRERAADMLGISRHSVQNVLKGECLPLEPGCRELRDRGMKMPEEDALVIRPALVALILEKATISLDSLHSRIQADNPSWH